MSRSNALSWRQWLPLFGLSAAAFIFNTSEFIPIGLLLDIGASFSLTEAQTGVMISVYAWGVMALSMPLMVLTSRFEFKKLLIWVMLLFTAGQAVSALAPTYLILIGGRLMVATAHAVFWSIASVIAARLVDDAHRPLALSLIATGSAIALIFGIPIGRMLGLAMGWRMTFAAIGLISAALTAYLAGGMPKLEATQPFAFRELPALLKNPVLISMYIVTVFITTGYYTGYSYIEPFMAQIAKMPAGMITAALTAFGVAGLAGSALFTRFYDMNRQRFMTVALTGVAASLLCMRTGAGIPFGMFAVCMAWGVCSTSFSIGFQSEIIRFTQPKDTAVAMSIYSGLYNLGIGTGAAIGGVVTQHNSVANVGYAGGFLAAVGVVIAVTAYFCAMRNMQKQIQT